MLDKWLDKKIHALGYIKADETATLESLYKQEKINEGLLDKRAAELERSIKASAKKSEQNADKIFTAKSKEMEKRLETVNKPLIKELAELRQKNMELERRLAEIDEIRKEGKKSKGEVAKKLKTQENRIAKLAYDQEVALETIQEFTQRYNSVIKPQSRFI